MKRSNELHGNASDRFRDMVHRRRPVLLRNRRGRRLRCVSMNNKTNPATNQHGPSHNNQHPTGRNSIPAALHPLEPATITLPTIEPSLEGTLIGKLRWQTTLAHERTRPERQISRSVHLKAPKGRSHAKTQTWA